MIARIQARADRNIERFGLLDAAELDGQVSLTEARS